MTLKRSRLEIYLDILRVIRTGVHKPTRIMYGSNLSWSPLQGILKSLIVQGLIVVVEERSRKKYEITEKGRRALRYFDQAKELVTIGEVREKSRQVYPI